MPKKAHYAEEVARAFALYMDYVRLVDIERILGVKKTTLANWRKQNVVVGGNEWSWDDIRTLSESPRAMAAAERAEENEARFEWEQYTATHKEEVAKALKKARETIVENLGEIGADGKPMVSMNVGQLKGIVEAELLNQGKATKIIEERVMMVQVVAEIVSKNAQLISNQRERDRLLDAVEQDFMKMMSVGGDPEISKKLTA